MNENAGYWDLGPKEQEVYERLKQGVEKSLSDHKRQERHLWEKHGGDIIVTVLVSPYGLEQRIARGKLSKMTEGDEREWLSQFEQKLRIG